MMKGLIVRLGSLLAIVAVACPLLVISTIEVDAQTSMRRRNQLPVVPRSVGRRQADRESERQAARPQTYVPGHFVWDNRRGQYSWVAGRWERYDPNHAFVGGGLQFRNGQWTVGPTR